MTLKEFEDGPVLPWYRQITRMGWIGIGVIIAIVTLISIYFIHNQRGEHLAPKSRAYLEAMELSAHTGIRMERSVLADKIHGKSYIRYTVGDNMFIEADPLP